MQIQQQQHQPPGAFTEGAQAGPPLSRKPIPTRNALGPVIPGPPAQYNPNLSAPQANPTQSFAGQPHPGWANGQPMPPSGYSGGLPPSLSPGQPVGTPHPIPYSQNGNQQQTNMQPGSFPAQYIQNVPLGSQFPQNHGPIQPNPPPMASQYASPPLQYVQSQLQARDPRTAQANHTSSVQWPQASGQMQPSPLQTQASNSVQGGLMYSPRASQQLPPAQYHELPAQIPVLRNLNGNQPPLNLSQTTSGYPNAVAATPTSNHAYNQAPHGSHTLAPMPSSLAKSLPPLGPTGASTPAPGAYVQFINPPVQQSQGHPQMSSVPYNGETTQPPMSQQVGCQGHPPNPSFSQQAPPMSAPPSQDSAQPVRYAAHSGQPGIAGATPNPNFPPTTPMQFPTQPPAQSNTVPMQYINLNLPSSTDLQSPASNPQPSTIGGQTTQTGYQTSSAPNGPPPGNNAYPPVSHPVHSHGLAPALPSHPSIQYSPAGQNNGTNLGASGMSGHPSQPIPVSVIPGSVLIQQPVPKRVSPQPFTPSPQANYVSHPPHAPTSPMVTGLNNLHLERQTSTQTESSAMSHRTGSSISSLPTPVYTPGTPWNNATPTPYEQTGPSDYFFSCSHCKAAITGNTSFFECLICAFASITAQFCVSCYTTEAASNNHPHDKSYYICHSDPTINVPGVSSQKWTVRRNASGRHWYQFHDHKTKTHVKPRTAISSTNSTGWEQRKNQDGRAFYYNVKTQDSSYSRPAAMLPEGWKEVKTPDGVPFYVHDLLELATWTVPGDQPVETNSNGVKNRSLSVASTGSSRKAVGSLPNTPTVRNGSQGSIAHNQLPGSSSSRGVSGNNKFWFDGRSAAAGGGVMATTKAVASMTTQSLKDTGKKMKKSKALKGVTLGSGMFMAGRLIKTLSALDGGDCDFGDDDFTFGGGSDEDVEVEEQSEQCAVAQEQLPMEQQPMYSQEQQPEPQPMYNQEPQQAYAQEPMYQQQTYEQPVYQQQDFGQQQSFDSGPPAEPQYYEQTPYEQPGAVDQQPPPQETNPTQYQAATDCSGQQAPEDFATPPSQEPYAAGVGPWFPDAGQDAASEPVSTGTETATSGGTTCGDGAVPANTYMDGMPAESYSTMATDPSVAAAQANFDQVMQEQQAVYDQALEQSQQAAATAPVGYDQSMYQTSAANTSVDANAAQLAMEERGRLNALTLIDGGTVVEEPATGTAADLI
ncbi:hypothetical protein K402DRAFT_457061 [Aulographum hederae CBS 113979]|uniref:WW domain-containing protein n=1 Tax=Aulographum hederae CBS 113979 TaxID=1176131 RepID=A0A6G1GPG9_9PEZI|nr:hypothetical protein K402DRAFT_457061 [Aulographum hederae CBS 113979]